MKEGEARPYDLTTRRLSTGRMWLWVISGSDMPSSGLIGSCGRSGVAPVRWTVNCFRDRHRTLSEGGTEIAPPVSIVDPEGTVRSLVPRDRSYIMGER